MSEWNVSELIKEGKLEVGDGYRAKNNELSSDGLYFARAVNINDGFKFENAECFPVENLKRVGNKISRPGDVVFTSKGTVGRFAFVTNETPRFIYSPQLCYWRCLDNDTIEPRYLYFWMAGSREFFEQMEATKGQTDMADYVSLSDQRKFKITLPPLPEQRAIASILGSLDDKIDLLHRQNRTLEALAGCVWREWFGKGGEDFDEELGNVIETTSGGTPSRAKMDFYVNGEICWVKSKELNGTYILETEEKITQNALKKSSAKILPTNSILIAMYGATVGEYAIIGQEMTCNQAVCALKPNENYPYSFLFLLAKQNKEELKNMAVGSGQQNISQMLIKKIPVPPSSERIKEFHQLVEPYFQKIKTNQTQIRTLTQLRDTLLPKLMSGEVRVR